MIEYGMLNDDGTVTVLRDMENGTTEMEKYTPDHEDYQLAWDLAQSSPAPTAPGPALTQAQLDAIAKAEFDQAVNAERDRRIEYNFVFESNSYQFDTNSKANIAGAATLAGFAVLAQPVAGFYRWHGGSSDFGWINWSNVLILMDANTCFNFGKAALDHESAHIFAARALKDGQVRSDYTDDSLWP